MRKKCKAECAKRGYPRLSILTRQFAVQVMKVRAVHAEQQSFSPSQRCYKLKGHGLPALQRLTMTKNLAVHRSKIYEPEPVMKRQNL